MNFPNHGIHPEWYPYKKFESKIRDFFMRERKKLEGFSLYEFDTEKPEKIFWDIVEGKDYQVDDVYYRILCYYVSYINYLILRDLGKINKETYLFWDSWMKYLHSKVFIPGYFMTYTDKTIEILATLIPFSEELPSVYQLLLDKPLEKNEIRLKKPIKEFWREFSYYFPLEYKVFLDKSTLIGEELATHRNKKKYSNLADIYQLKPNSADINQYTPQSLKIDLNTKMFELIHIRNAISHHLYAFHDLEDTITIWDKNKKSEETYRKTYTKEDLIKAEYNLHLLRAGLEKVAIYYSVIRHLVISILKKDIKNKTMILCPRCNKIIFEFLLPKQDRVLCNLCGAEMDLNDAKRINFSKSDL